MVTINTNMTIHPLKGRGLYDIRFSGITNTGKAAHGHITIFRNGYYEVTLLQTVTEWKSKRYPDTAHKYMRTMAVKAACEKYGFTLKSSPVHGDYIVAADK